jgi:hypothetical protein
MAKNLCGKTRDKSDPYEVWQSHDGSWTWHVLKKWQADDAKPYARWFCNVVTPMCPYGEMGDVYVQEIKDNARCIKSSDAPLALSRPAKW